MIMNKYLWIILFFASFLFSCSENKTDTSKLEVSLSDTLNLVSYADNFDLYAYKSGYKLIIKDNSSLEKEFYLFNDTVEVPSELKNSNVIKTPVKNAVAFSSTQWSVFLKLNEMQRVKGVLEAHYSTNPEIIRLMNEGKIADVGTNTTVNTEKLIVLNPDVILITPYPNVDYSYLSTMTDASLIPFPDYMESHPLGRAEWLKVVGILCDKYEETSIWFDSIESKYNRLSDLCAEVTDKPTVFSDLPFENQWYVPGGKSYIAQIFSDAAADYIWKDNSSTASLQVDAEIVLSKAQNADYWRVINSYDSPFTYQKLEQENELFSLFKAFKEKKILVCDSKLCGYFEQSQYEPEILLADFIYHFHPDLLEKEYKNYSPKYFKLLIK